MTEHSGTPPEPRRRAARLFGEAATQSAPRPPRVRPGAPKSLRGAALVVAVEAVLLAAAALLLLYLTVTGAPDSVGRAVAEVVLVGGLAALLGAAAVGLWRVARWARGPVVALQILLGLIAFTAAFQDQRPLIGLPVLALVLAELYLLAAPASRLAFHDEH